MQITGHDIRVEYINNVFVNSKEDQGGWQDWKERLKEIAENMPTKADELNPVIQFLIATIAPSKIFMINQGGNSDPGSTGYIDLLLVMSGKCTSPFTELEPIIEIASLKDERVCCSLHNEGSVLEGLKTGNLFYSLNFIPDNLVYDDETVKYPIISSKSIGDLKEKAKEKFSVAFKKAEHFYKTAVVLHREHPSQILGFMLHQAVELTYRAILRTFNGYDKKTHEIRSLKKHVRRFAAPLNSVFPDDSEDEKNLLEILEAAYLNARYQDSYSVPEKDLAVLLERIKQLLRVASEIVESKLG